MLEERVGPTAWHLEVEGGLRPQQLCRGQSPEDLAWPRTDSPLLNSRHSVPGRDQHGSLNTVS